MKFALFLTTIFLLSACSQKQFVSISNKIRKNSNEYNRNWKGTSFHDLRVKLFNEGKLKFISWGSDTVYLLESYEIESGTYYGRIWNEKDVLDYEFHNGGFNFNISTRFTAYTVQLVRRWDIKAVRDEERVHSNSIPERNVNISRVIMVDGENLVECFKFKEFFEPERDR